MKKSFVNPTIYIIFLICFTAGLFAQNNIPKKAIGESEKAMIQKAFNEISVSDQLYRGPLSKGTLDKTILSQIDSVFDNEGIKAGMIYEKSLNLSLPKEVEDSLWQLQAAIDFRNHLTLRGLFDTYGFISEEVIKEKQYVQILLLMHPPKDWDVRTYLKEYSDLLIVEVKANRMPPKTYATFYDNMKAKILREPQLYGTNQQFDTKTNTILPPIIEDLTKSNQARNKIGLPMLKEGEYRLATKTKPLLTESK